MSAAAQFDREDSDPDDGGDKDADEAVINELGRKTMLLQGESLKPGRWYIHVVYPEATIAPFALQALVLGAPIGPFGLVSTRQSYARPWWDEQTDGAVYPLFHVAADLAEAGLHAAAEARANDPRLAALAWESDGRRTLLVANLSAAPIDVSISGLTDPLVRILDAETLPQAARDPDRFRVDLRPLGQSRAIALDAYATARIQEGARL